MSSSINLSNSVVGVLRSPLISNKEDPRTSSGEARVRGAAAAAIAGSALARDVSAAKVLGGAGIGDSRMVSSPSPHLEPAPAGARYFLQELGKPTRHTSFSLDEPPMKGPSPLLKSFLTGCNSSARPSSSPDSSKISPLGASPDKAASPVFFGVKYDSQKNYKALGDRKTLEDLPPSEGVVAPHAAYAYLQSMMDVPGDFEVNHYLETNRLLLGIADEKKIRDVTRSTYCIVPEKFAIESIMSRDGARLELPIERILDEETGNKAVNIRTITGKSGHIRRLYKIDHNFEKVNVRLSQFINEFNVQIAEGYASSLKHGNVEHLNAIVLLFMRIEQISPVNQCRRTNLAVINYLLAKHNLPGVIFKKQYTGRESTISTIDYMSFDHLTEQVIQGMKDWCKESGRPYPFE